MSYSFAVRASTLAAADLAIAAELEKIAAAQPVHDRDRGLALATAINMLGECAVPEENEEWAISVAGSCFGQAGQPFEGLSLSIHINTLSKTS
ncbi:hypothetical protein [Novosphingobium sp.]|jgi:hypothetical protein|uniref:hypothetical protein n=1 Tax=Novosphingobium sp. TaxID=1874826 RepID=UPI00260C7EBC|nr:hypothetical protein [Novosphingobium sp.]